MTRFAKSGADIARRTVVVLAYLAAGCSREPAPSGAEDAPAGSTVMPPTEAAWLLAGSTDDRFVRVARQLRGFDVAMAETGYRYGELYWAGQDRNWDYAKYQVEKIRTAVKNGVERRPKRGPSAQMLEDALQGVESAIGAKDAALFAERFEGLTGTCNACHVAERVPFVRVWPPSVRVSPVGPSSGDGGLP